MPTCEIVGRVQVRCDRCDLAQALWTARLSSSVHVFELFFHVLSLSYEPSSRPLSP